MKPYDEKAVYRVIQHLAAGRGWFARMNRDEPRIGEGIPKFMLVARATGIIEHGRGYSLTAREALGILTGVLSSIGDPVLPPSSRAR